MKLLNIFLALALLFICGCERAEEMTRDALVETPHTAACNDGIPR